MNPKYFLKIFIEYIRDNRFHKAFCYIINTLDYLISIKLLKRKEAVRKVNKYPLILTFDEEGISKNLLIHRVREIAETDIIKDIIKPGMSILEIGANIGYYTILMGKLVGETGRVYSFEPYPSSFEVLQKNIKLNNLLRIVETHNTAISNKSAIQKFYLGQASNVHTLMDLNPEMNEKQYFNVETIDINTFLEENNTKIDLIRMDIEGHERDIFSRLGELQSDLLPEYIFFEIHPLGDIDPDPTFHEPIQKILNLGYYPDLVISSTNISAFRMFKELQYFPFKTYNLHSKRTFLYNNIKINDLLKVAARRPKITRAILLKKLN